jgi:flagellar hook-associated protein 2
VSVVQDSSSAATAIKAFVNDFNAALNAVDAATKIDTKDLGNSGVLSGDASVRSLRSTLRSLITGTGVAVAGNLKNLSQVGLSFGAVGSALGTTNLLQFDEAKFKAAQLADPASVQALFSTFTLTASLAGGGTGSVASASGTYSGPAGSYLITDDGAGGLSSIFTPTDGGAQTTVNATVVANGTNTTLIPGMTLQIGPMLQAGSHTVNVAVTASSPLRQLQDFLEGQAGTGGVLLKHRFALMEQAYARAQQSMGTLQAASARLASG